MLSLPSASITPPITKTISFTAPSKNLLNEKTTHIVVAALLTLACVGGGVAIGLLCQPLYLGVSAGGALGVVALTSFAIYTVSTLKKAHIFPSENVYPVSCVSNQAVPRLLLPENTLPGLTKDLIQEISLILPPQDTLRMSRLSKGIRAYLMERGYHRAIHEIVRERYYAAANCPIKGLTPNPRLQSQHMSSLLRTFAPNKDWGYQWHMMLGKPLTADYMPPVNNKLVLFINDKGLLSVKLYTNLSHEKQLLHQNEILSGKYRDRIFKVAQELFKYHTLIAQDFIDKNNQILPLNEENPIQDMRDRLRLFQVIEKERFTLECALAVCPNPEKAPLLPEIPLTQFAINKINIGTSEITLSGKTIPLSIELSLDLEWCYTKFVIYDSKGVRLGEMKLAKKWFNKKGYTLLLDDHDLALFSSPQEKINGPILFFYFLESWGTRDEQTNDRPLLKMMMQIAIEVLIRESIDVLRVSTNDDDPYVFLPAGFKAPSSLINENAYLGLLNEVREARANGKAYPDESLQSYQLSFTKEQVASDELDKLAYVDLLAENRIIWKEQIAKNPILKGTGPLLPKFFQNDMYKFQEEHNTRLAEQAAAPAQIEEFEEQKENG